MLSAALQKPVTLEFREAPLRSVFEALARSHGVNAVFDKDVRADTRVTLFLRDVALDEALRMLLRTQQLDAKVLNANTLLVYPATAAKQREHQDLVARTIYLTHADVKNTVTLLRNIAKVQEIHADERLNAIVLRESPEVVRLVEDLVAAIDLPDAEVMIDVEVLEVSSARLDELGLKWPERINFGVFDSDGRGDGTVALNRDLRLSARIVNPAVVATLRGSKDNGNTLANPSIRARNREKAQVHVGEKLPVFTTTSVPNAGVAAAVSYLDVGIKLDVEPSVQLDDEVQIKVGLEVSNVLRQVSGPAGSIGYQVGTRRTSTTLRLRDGETQVLAGLLRDEDLRNMSGLPGLSSLPLLGRLFGVQADTRNKTEIVLLMTPRVLRNLPVPDASQLQVAAGTALNPGAQPLRLGERARAALAPGRGGPAPAATQAAAPPPPAGLELASSGKVAVGGTVAVTLHNRGLERVAGELVFDPSLLRNAAGSEDNGRLGFELQPGEQRAFVLRAQPGSAGRSSEVSVSLREGLGVPVMGSAPIEITPP
jgi:general secretion pathway protein D